MVYVFDIDGTICSHTNGDYNDAKPFRNRIDKNNSLYNDGHTMIYYTARGMGRTNNNISQAYRLFYELTKKQLCDWNVKHHKLFLGKPNGDIYVDDKGMKDADFYTD